MSEEDEGWEDLGPASHGFDPIMAGLDALDGTELRRVRNLETGEERVVFVGSNQTLGEAIANGQFR